jgi:hypothetical protein
VPAPVTASSDDARGRGQPAADPYARYRFVGNVFALVILVATLFEFWRNFVQPSDRDFLAPWAAAQLALAGRPWAAYDSGALHAVQAAVATFGGPTAELPFPYPPAYLLLAIPFALMSFPAGLVAWSAGTFAFYLFAARKLMPRSGWLAAAFPAAFANAAIGQNAFLTAGLFMAGMSLLPTSPFAAGAVLGCLVVKPQLAMLLPVALIAGRQWRAVAGAAASSVAILFLGFVLFGPATTAAWLDEAPLIVKVTGDGLMGWGKLASIYAAARQMSVPAGPAIGIHLVVAAAAAAMVWRLWSSPAEPAAKVSMLAAGSTLISPYVFYYDALILVPSFLYLARSGERPAVLLALWCIPLLLIGQIGGGDLANLNALVPLVLMALTYRWSRATEPVSGGASLIFRQPSAVRISQPVRR